MPAFYAICKVPDFNHFRESELNQNTYYLIAQELAYQWVGALISPYWYTDFHINKAVTGSIAAIYLCTWSTHSFVNLRFYCRQHCPKFEQRK
jgi:hypothetical protein